MPAPDPLPVAERRVFACRIDAASRTADFAREFCASRRLSAALGLRLTLVLEELFTNTVRHGHGGDCDRLVAVELRLEGRHLHLVYEDDAPAFDPVGAAHRSALELDDLRPSGRVGGLGLPLTLGMVRQAQYARVDGRNRVELVIVEQPAATGADPDGSQA